MTKYLNAELASVIANEDVGEYPLPFDPDITVRVRSVPMARMKQYQEALVKGGSLATAATKDLIRESIIDESGEAVYTKDTAEKLLKGRTRLIAALVNMISKHNGGDDKISEDAEKKSEPTD